VILESYRDTFCVSSVHNNKQMRSLDYHHRGLSRNMWHRGNTVWPTSCYFISCCED